jgi:hypothetical protein
LEQLRNIAREQYTSALLILDAGEPQFPFEQGNEYGFAGKKPYWTAVILSLGK